MHYRPEIDGLRAIAVLAVVLFHADHGLMPGGFVGVDVFFVISGYLITSILASEWRTTGRLDFAAFYARRVRRILPALATMIVLVMAGAVVFLGRHGSVFEHTGESALASLVFLANFYFQVVSGGYFDAPNESMPLLHLWSLSVEEQYYLLYPALLALLLKLAPGGVARRLVALSLFSLLLAEFWVRVEPERAFFQMPARFWELALGGLVALSAGTAGGWRGRQWLIPTGAAFIAFACVCTPEWGSFPGIGALPAVLGSSLVLWGVHCGATVGRVAGMLRSPGFVTIGLLSYSLYLWHWPLLAFDFNLRIEPAPTSWRLLLCLAAIGMAWLSWRFVEQPFRGVRGRSPHRDIGLGVAATGGVAVLVLVLAQMDRIPPELKRVSDFARGDHPANMADCHFPSSAAPDALKPAACWSRPSQEPAVALWGDSHAMAWQPFVRELAESADASMAGATMNSCLPNGGDAFHGDSRWSASCTKLNELTLRWLTSGSIDTLVIGLRWPMLAPEVADPPDILRMRVDGLDQALDRLRRLPRILLMGPVPELGFPAPGCISLGWEDVCEMSRKDFEAATALAWRALHQLAADHPNVQLVDSTSFFCDDERCPVMRDGYALYWDDNHISSTAARAFARRYLAEPASYAPPPDRSGRPARDRK